MNNREILHWKRWISIILALTLAFSTSVNAGIFGVVYTLLHGRVMTSKGVEYEVTVRYEKGILPDGAELKVREIEKGSEEYQKYLAASQDAVEGRVTDAGFLDIEIQKDGKKIEPKGEVTVEIIALEGSVAGASVVHFEEMLVINRDAGETASAEEADLKSATSESIDADPPLYVNASAEADSISYEEPLLYVEEEIPLATENIAKLMDTEEVEDSLVFKTDSFSIYGVIYTVDFHWNVNGKRFYYSIPGGGFMSFTELIEMIGVANLEEDSPKEDNKEDKLEEPTEHTETPTEISKETRDFVEQVESVVFSDPSLLWVGKVESDITVGELKQNLEVEYSSDLSEEQIEEINSRTVSAGDRALISLKPFDTQETLTITMKDGEEFKVFVTDVQDPLGIDDRTVAIVYLTQGVANDGTSNGDALTLSKWYANIEQLGVGYMLKNDVEYCDENAVVWLFEYIPDQDAYYISNGYHSDEEQCHYLTFGDYTYDNNGNTQNAHGFNVTLGKSNAVPVKIKCDDQGVYYIYYEEDGQKHYLTKENRPGWRGFYTQASTEDYPSGAKLHFCLPEESGNDAPHKATMIWAKDLQPGQKVVIYQRVLYTGLVNPVEGEEPYTYHYYAVDGDGDAQRVYNSSDSVYWRGNLEIEWEVVDPGNGYYYLRNLATGKYLAPKGDGSIVYEISLPEGATEEEKAEAFKHVNIGLPGKRADTYSSKISNWDYNWNSTNGLLLNDHYDETDGWLGDVSAVGFGQSEEFFFAVRDPIVQGELTEVDTVNNVEKGITIKMYDFDGQGQGSHTLGNVEVKNRLQFMNDLMGNDHWHQGEYTPGMLTRYLDDDGEYPKIAGNTRGEKNTSLEVIGNSLRDLFTPGIEYAQGSTDIYKKVDYLGEVNNLFIQNIYDSSGYYHYSCFENAAYLNGTSFEVYEQLATNRVDTAKYAQRGNFWPLDVIDTTSKGTNNYDHNLESYADSDYPRAGEDVYYVVGDDNHLPNAFFGMTMEAKFAQNPEGLSDHGDPMVFEFNGDDDMWIYVDKVLLLDIGGVHDAFRGKINFKTGEITVIGPDQYNSDTDALEAYGVVEEQTYIKEQFWMAGRFPDGTLWEYRDDPKADEFFTNEGETSDGKLKGTFKELTTHDLKMFYLERGAGASQIEMSFNLPVLPESQFRVKKEIPETVTGGLVNSYYGNTAFYYKAWRTSGPSTEYVPCTRTYYTQSDTKATYQDGSPVEWLDETIFKLRPGQTATFPVENEAVQYYVEEVDDQYNMLDDYLVSNNDQETRARSLSDGTIVYDGTLTNKSTVKNRYISIYQNKPKDDIVNELQITKKVYGKHDTSPYNETDAFEYRIILERADGKMVPYSEGKYYQTDKNGNYVYFDTINSGGTVTVIRKTAVREIHEGAVKYKYEYIDGRVEYLTEPKYTEVTSTNGSLSNVQDGDTIHIPGLLVGTNYYVYERTDFDYMAKSELFDEDGEKYVFIGAENVPNTVGPAFIPIKIEDEFNIFELPSQYYPSSYEHTHAANGAIIEESDARVLVKNKPKTSLKVKKAWQNINPEDERLKNAQIKVVLGRYSLQDKAGKLSIIKTGVPIDVNLEAAYEIKKDGITYATYYYNKGHSDVASVSLAPGTYTITETIISDDSQYESDHPDKDTPKVIEIADGDNKEECFDSDYDVLMGSLKINSVFDGADSGLNPSVITYTIYKADSMDPVGVYDRAHITENQIINIPIGNYIIIENNVPYKTGYKCSSDPNDHKRTATISQDSTEVINFTNVLTKERKTVHVHVIGANNEAQFFDKEDKITYYVGDTLRLRYSRNSNEIVKVEVNGVALTGDDVSDGGGYYYRDITLTDTKAEIIINSEGYSNGCGGTNYGLDNITIQNISPNGRMNAPSGSKRQLNSSNSRGLTLAVPIPPEGKKYVDDVSYNIEVTLTYNDIVNGSWEKTISDLDAADIEGNEFRYYIKNVVETGFPNGIVVVPSYDNDPVDAYGGTLSLTNIVHEYGSIKITKIVTVNNTSPNETNAPFTDGEYTFRVFESDGRTRAQKNGADIPDVIITFENGGAISPTEGYALITEMEPGTYVIKEIEIPSDMTLSSASRGDNDADAVDNDKAVTVVVTAGDSYATQSTSQASFINNIGVADIPIEKVDKNSASRIPDAVFQMYKMGTSGFEVFENNAFDEVASKHIGPFTVTDGYIEIMGLTEGLYQLHEKEAPDGYIISFSDAFFKIDGDGDITFTDIDGTPLSPQPDVQSMFYFDDEQLTIKNEPGGELPSTGGIGTYYFYLFGVVTTISAWILLKMRNAYR